MTTTAPTYTHADVVAHLERLGWQPEPMAHQPLVNWHHPEHPDQFPCTLQHPEQAADVEVHSTIARVVHLLTILHRSRRLEELQP